MSERRAMSRQRQLRRRRTIVVAVGLLVVAAIVVLFAWVIPALASGNDAAADGSGDASSATTEPDATASAAPPQEELTPAQELLAGTDDPAACAVTFAGEDIADAPQLQTTGALYAALPIPDREGSVFAGWYATPEAAAAHDHTQRVNGADEVACTEQEITLYGAWMSPEENAAADTAVPILMYHQFTEKPEGEEGWLRLNYAFIGDWEAHMAYIAEKQFYLPTWDELSAFIDGRLYLPYDSLIVTDDDADATWLDLAVPIAEEYKVLTTSFVITSARTEPAPSKYVLQRSHTHDMHTAGDNGQGRMVNWSAADIATDLETSAGILGAKEVIAYPFGHHDERSKEGVAAAGFEMARTIEQGYVRIGTDKLALPCIRINFGMNVDALKGLVE